MAQELRIKGAKTVPSVCPYCAVGYSSLVHVPDGKILNVEGDPRSPHNEDTRCPKGPAIRQLHVNPDRQGPASRGGLGPRARGKPRSRARQEDTRRDLTHL